MPASSQPQGYHGISARGSSEGCQGLAGAGFGFGGPQLVGWKPSASSSPESAEWGLQQSMAAPLLAAAATASSSCWPPAGDREHARQATAARSTGRIGRQLQLHTYRHAAATRG